MTHIVKLKKLRAAAAEEQGTKMMEYIFRRRCPSCEQLRLRLTEYPTLTSPHCSLCDTAFKEASGRYRQGGEEPNDLLTQYYKKQASAVVTAQPTSLLGTACNLCGVKYRQADLKPSDEEMGPINSGIHDVFAAYNLQYGLCPKCRKTPLELTEGEKELLDWYLTRNPRPKGEQDNRLEIELDSLTASDIHHVWILGRSGYGKTTLIKQLLRHHFASGAGCAFIDPHGDAAEELLGHVPESRLADVIYFAPASPACPSFNLLALPYRKDKLADDLVSLFKLFFADSWGHRLEMLLKNGLLTLLDDTEAHSLADLQRLFTHSDYRKEIAGRTTHEKLRHFWEEEFPALPKDAPQSLLNKLHAFLGPFSPLERLFSSTRNDLDFPSIMNGQKIFLANLSKGDLGAETTALLGGMLMTAFSQAALARTSTGEHERVPFHLFADEFQTYLVASFATILEEARKYRLHLTLANQTLDQVSGLQSSLFGNVSALVVFQVAAADAARLIKEMKRIIVSDPDNESFLYEAGRLRICASNILASLTSRPNAPICAPAVVNYFNPPEAYSYRSVRKVIEDINFFRSNNQMRWNAPEKEEKPTVSQWPTPDILQSFPKLSAAVRRHTLHNVHSLKITYPPPPDEKMRRLILDATQQRYAPATPPKPPEKKKLAAPETEDDRLC